VEDKEQKPLKVVDKRHFTHGGERREPDAAAAAFIKESGGPQASAPSPPAAKKEKSSGSKQEAPGSVGAESLGFAEFILSLSSSAFVNLGQIPNPMTGQPEMDLEAAGSIIDVLQVLEQKTQGNLTPYEKEVMEKTLYQLKLIYVQARQRNSA
jgi:hypothetical protein